MIKKYFLVILLVLILTSVAWAASAAWSDKPLTSLTKANDEIHLPITSAVNVDFSQSHSLPYVSSDMVLFENVIVGSERYAVLMRWQLNGLKPIWAGNLNKVEIPFCTITIDGNSADWAGIPPVVIDPDGDENPQYNSIPGTDIANVSVAHDNTYLYFMMTLHDGDPNPGMEGHYAIEFQQYLTQLHTPGDRVVYVTPNPDENEWFISIQDRTGGDEIAKHPSDHVGIGVGMLEFKVPIVDMQYPENTPSPYYSPSLPSPGIENQFIRVYIHPGPFTDPIPPVSDENDELTRVMVINFY